MFAINRSSPDLPSAVWPRLEKVVNRFEKAHRDGLRPLLDEFLHEEGIGRKALLIELIHADLEFRYEAGEPIAVESYLKRYPEMAEDRQAVLQLIALEHTLRARREPVLALEDYLRRFPDFAEELRLHWQEKTEIKPDQWQVLSTNVAPVTPLRRIGRYRVEKILGQGGFGLVYLAYDEGFARRVAIKVPHRALVAHAEDAAAYLAEARTVAGLYHPNIVPVYDMGTSADCPFFVVSKFIDGSTLARRIKEDRPSVLEATQLVATVAETLHYAHRQGLVHRDVKPSNILLEWRAEARTTGENQPAVPYVADFGLALREKDFGKGAGLAGTPAYMSPEQARGEGHRVDGRSDIFSLGVVFYELLTGVLPFQAGGTEALLEQIKRGDVRPPRQRDDTIPKELERICLKALAKRRSERHTTAKDLAEDLWHFLSQSTDEDKLALGSRVSASADSAAAAASQAAVATPVPTPHPTPVSDSHPIRIVPKGLRPFDAGDADFFLELLPGPSDRNGLPDNIRFWKARIEERDPDNTFSVGLIWGPSGCGKSSLVRAGLLPRLSKDVISVYVEATAEDTERRLLANLRRRCPALPAKLGLEKTLGLLRRGQGLPADKKVLIVLDQFEQWLHANKEPAETALVGALRQCDGRRTQCVVLVRDDFWLAVNRFMQALEVRALEGENFKLVDLFDLRHARKVMTALGRAFGALPEAAKGLTKDQDVFLDEAVTSLAHEGEVICVRLALFAEMIKGKSWLPGTLKEVGGAEGVGVAFLEETFSSASASPEHRYHQKAARSVLKALLPEVGTDIKRHMRSRPELLAASGYVHRPREFDKLVRILDGELRLITPTDPEGQEGQESLSHAQAGAQYYQLTHDYLVPSLRDWLTYKQKQTRRGRAELLLADRASAWSARPENRQLPSLWQWLRIRWLTRRKSWTPPQRQMMRRATRLHVTRGSLVAVLLGLLGLAAWQGHGRLEARRLRDRLLGAATVDVPRIVKEMAPYRGWLNPLLYEAQAQGDNNNQRERLHGSLALLPMDPGQVDYLYGRLLEAESQDVLVIRDALFDHRQQLTERLWSVLENPKNDQDQRLRASCALAAFAPDDARWEKVSADVAAALVMQKPFVIAKWAAALTGVEKSLIPVLADFLVDENRGLSERALIASVYGTFAADLPDAHARLETRLTEKVDPKDTLETRIARAKRLASIGVALLAMARGERVWPLLGHQPDPTVRSYLIDRLGPGGVDAKFLLSRLDEEQDTSARRAVLLSLGEFGLDRLAQAQRQNLLPCLLQLYRNDPDPGIHAAITWLLRQWRADAPLKDIDAELATGKVEGRRQWYIDRQGQTMVLVAKPGEFWIVEGKQRRKGLVSWNYAIAANEVTLEQFLKLRPTHPTNKKYSPSLQCPAIYMTWYEAAECCNRLSEREGIPKDQWCYEPNAQGQYAEGMKVAPGHLGRTGYRLPTEVEWVHACRAGSDVEFAFGQSEELLRKYGWYYATSNGKSYPTGTLRPNDLGLFDMYGNAGEWCEDEISSTPAQAVEDKEGMRTVSDKAVRVIRGGSFMDIASGIRTANLNNGPKARNSNVGFRVVRTVP